MVYAKVEVTYTDNVTETIYNVTEFNVGEGVIILTLDDGTVFIPIQNAFKLEARTTTGKVEVTTVDELQRVSNRGN